MQSFITFVKEEIQHRIGEWKTVLDLNPMLAVGVDLCDKIEQLESNGEALIVGGVVRDIVLGKEIYDVDIATNVDLDMISRVFKTTDIGKSKDFGIVNVRYKDYNFEVAHYREEFGSSDSRHPDEVREVDSFEPDSARRDLTINSMGVTKDGIIIDYQGGLEDLKNEIIRAVGIPQERFVEDALRILRTARFASKYGFSIDPETKTAMKELVHLVDTLSVERIQEELYKVASNGINLATYIEHLNDIGVLERVLPEIKKMQGSPHSAKHHPEGDVYKHTLAALRVSRSNDPVTNLAILFHDVGKPSTYKNRDGRHTYYSHDVVGKDVIKNIGKRLKFKTRDIEAIQFAARRHMNVHDLDKLKINKVVSIVNSPFWSLLKDVSFADEMSRGGLGNAAEFNSKMANAEEKVQALSAGGGSEGLRLRIKELVNGNNVQKWIPELKTNIYRPFIGQIIRKTTEWIINNNRFEASEEEFKKFALMVFEQLKSQHDSKIKSQESPEENEI